MMIILGVRKKFNKLKGNDDLVARGFSSPLATDNAVAFRRLLQNGHEFLHKWSLSQSYFWQKFYNHFTISLCKWPLVRVTMAL